MDYCEQGQKEGARLVYGGKRLDRPGKNYYRLPSKNIVANLIKFDGLDKASTNYDKTGTNFVYVHVFVML